jgi:hypothetical protein
MYALKRGDKNGVRHEVVAAPQPRLVRGGERSRA